jgi:O-antigen/teichoic acid export membrane protein
VESLKASRHDSRSIYRGNADRHGPDLSLAPLAGRPPSNQVSFAMPAGQLPPDSRSSARRPPANGDTVVWRLPADRTTEDEPKSSRGTMPTAPAHSPGPVHPKKATPAHQDRSGKSFAGDTAVRIVTDVITLLCALASFILLTRALGKPSYAVYVGLYSFLNPLTPLAFSGAIAALFQSVVRDEMPLQMARSRTAGICLLSSLAAVPISLIAAHYVVAGASVVMVTLYVAADLILLGQQSTTIMAVRIESGVKPSAVLNLISPISKVAVYVAALSLGWSLHDMALPYFAVAVAVTAIVAYVGRRLTGTHAWPSRPERRRWTTAGNYSSAQIAWGFQDSGDKIAMSTYNDPNLPAYGAAYRICAFAFIPLGALDQATNHLFVSRPRKGQMPHLTRAWRFTVVALVYSLFFVAGIFVAAPALPLILGDEWADSVTMLRWLSLLVPFRALGMFPSSALVGVGRLHLRTTVMIINAIITGVLYIVLVKSAQRGTFVSFVVVLAQEGRKI